MRLIDADRFLSQIEDQYMEHDITRSQYMDLEDRIMQQPTVQPQTSMLTVECKFDDEELAKAIEEVKRANLELIAADPHWIPCSERLPENGQIVLAYTDWEECRVMKRNESIWDNQREQLRYFWEEQSSEMLDYEKDTVIAWMPLPEPYKEGQE